MSIGAYRVNQIELGGETFNLWHDEKVAEYLDNKGYFEQLNMDLCGFIDIPVTALEAMLEIADDDEVKNNIKIDIAFANENKKEYLLYECF